MTAVAEPASAPAHGPRSASFDGLEPSAPCLVVGGGLIGSHVASALTAAGHPVTVYSRSFSPWLIERLPRLPATRLVTGELPDGGSLSEHIAAAEVVFVVVGFSTPALSDGDATVSLVGSLVPSLSVLDAARRTTTKRILIASSGGTVYGNVQVLPTPEIHACQPISVHGVNAVVLEEYVHFFAREHGLQTTTLRFSNVYGPGQYVRGEQGVIAAWCRALARREPVALIGEGSVRRDFLFAADAAQAALAAARHAGPGTYNVGSGTATALDEILELLRSISGVDFEIAHRPERSVDVPITMLDTSKLASATGWRPSTALERGLELTWDWFAGHPHDRAHVPTAWSGSPA